MVLLFLGSLRSGSAYLASGAVTVDLTAMGMEKVELEGRRERKGRDSPMKGAAQAQSGFCNRRLL